MRSIPPAFLLTLLGLFCAVNLIIFYHHSSYMFLKLKAWALLVKTLQTKPPAAPSLTGGGILYLVKACGRFERRSISLYDSWGWRVDHIVFSTDQLLNESRIPLVKQRVQPVPASLVGRMQSIPQPAIRKHAESCVVTLLNLARILEETDFQQVEWLMVVDDDTFVLEKNLLPYLGNFSSLGKYYLGLSNAEPLPLYGRRGKDGGLIAVAATAPGILYSKGLLNDMRERNRTLFTADAVYKQCVEAQYGDDVALGLLSQVQLNASLIARPDLRGFHWHTEQDPRNVQPITIHTEQQFAASRLQEMHALALRYFGSLKPSIA